VDELVQTIRMGILVLGRLARSEQPFVVEGKNVPLGTSGKDGKATVVCIAFDPRSPSFKGCLSTLSSYEVTMSRVEHEDATVLLLRLSSDGLPLDAAGLKRLLGELNTSLASCSL
jgi:hypothetical protein